jgi:hypothetical protein
MIIKPMDWLHSVEKKVVSETIYNIKPLYTERSIVFFLKVYFVSGQYGCLFSRCRKYVINSLIHGHFHIGLVIIPRPTYWPSTPSRANMGRGMITRPIWKCKHWMSSFSKLTFLWINYNRINYWSANQWLCHFCVILN